MQLTDAITLIKDGFQLQQHKSVWADLGCGTGLFTQAVARLLSPQSMVYAIDKSNVTLSEVSGPANITIRFIQLDFEKEIADLNGLDGMLMANSLHYVRDKIRFIERWQEQLKPHARFVIVEYDTEKANPWVPFPISFASLQLLFGPAGYTHITKIGSMPSRYRNGNLYAALITR